MQSQLVVAGGGIGGLAAALAAARAGWQAQVFERAAAFAEVGAGVQLGPNATRLLQGWGLGPALDAAAAYPPRLQARSAVHGGTLAQLDLAALREEHGAPYATLHRADLHALLLQGAQASGAVDLQPGRSATGLQAAASQRPALTFEGGWSAQGDALVVADGVWSGLRQALLGDGPAPATGHLAWRALLPQATLPPALRSQWVTAWLGPRHHVVAYPVRRGDFLNVVAIVHGSGAAAGALQEWDAAASGDELALAFTGACAPLRDLLACARSWRLWMLADRDPMRGPHEMARGRVALLGDAAHPMLPYLAQGAGMALEDAAVLAQSLQLHGREAVPAALSRYAALRWRRAAHVQRRARRNGEIFHMTGPLRLARDAALRLLGPRLLGMPWLYGAKV